MLSGAIYGVVQLLRHAWKVRGWSHEGKWKEFAF